MVDNTFLTPYFQVSYGVFVSSNSLSLSLPPSSLSFLLPFFHYSFFVSLPLSVSFPFHFSLSLSLRLSLCLCLSLSLSQHLLSLGADLVLHSMTKYLNGNPFNFSDKHFNFFTFLLGHCDVLMGALCTNNKEIHEKLKFLQLGKDVVRQRILLNFDIFLYILVNFCILKYSFM